MKFLSGLKKQASNPVELPPMSTGAAPLQVEKQSSSQEILQKLGLEKEPFACCVDCHEGKAALFTGRKIPFHEPKALRAKLSVKSISSERTLYEEILERVKPEAVGHMPPHGEQLDAAEIKALDLYISKIKNR